jgi:hypothetical protein
MTHQSLSPNENPKRSWQQIAIELAQEDDPQKIVQLSHEMNDLMLEEERQKVQVRFRASSQ